MLTHSTPDQHVVLPPFATGPLMETLRAANRQAGPVRATFIADLLGIPDRTARHYLTSLEQIGLVDRPGGPRQGWIASRRDAPAPAETGAFITRAEAARRAGVSYYTVCRWIAAGYVQAASGRGVVAASVDDFAHRLTRQELITKKEAAHRLGVCYHTILKRAKAGCYQLEQVGGRQLIVAASLSNRAQIDKTE